jgi:TRAP-type uncharacterized transport system fused permease subunit
VNRSLILTRNACNSLFWLFGIGLSLYLAAACFGYVSNSSEHYSNFIFGVVGMSGFHAINEIVHHRSTSAGRDDAWFWVRFSLAVIITLAALASAGYVRLYAVHLETTQPFFGRFDFNVGLVFLCSILALNWFHWGALLTIIIAGSVLYFFYGYLIPYPLLATPEYDPEFVITIWASAQMKAYSGSPVVVDMFGSLSCSPAPDVDR